MKVARYISQTACLDVAVLEQQVGPQKTRHLGLEASTQSGGTLKADVAHCSEGHHREAPQDT